MESYIYRSAGELAEMIRNGKASSVDIVSEHITRIRKLDGRINAIVMASAGPLARNIADHEVLWKVITGPHICDRNIPRIDRQPPTGKPLPDYRIAWVEGWPGFPTSRRPVSDAIRKLVMALLRGSSKYTQRKDSVKP